VQYVFLWALREPNSRAAPGSLHSSYATGHSAIILSMQSTCWSPLVYFCI